MNYRLLTSLFTFGLTSTLGWAAYPVNMVGFSGEPAEVFRAMRDDLKTIRTIQEEDTKPDIRELVEMARSSKKIFKLMSERIALEQYGKKLQTMPGGSVKATDANSLSFNGKGFEGGNFGFIDHLVGQSGLPIAFDREMPTNLLPIPNSFNSSIQGMLQNMRSIGDFSNITQAFMPETILNNVMGTAVQSAMNQIARTQIAPGIFVRDYLPGLDDAFATFSTSSNPATLLAYNQSRFDAGYSPLAGLNDAMRSAMSHLNVSNIASNGAYQAVNSFLKKQGLSDGQANPYASFAGDMMGQIVHNLTKTPPGQPLVITPQQVQKARSTGGPDVAIPVPANLSKTPRVLTVDLTDTRGRTLALGAVTGTQPKQSPKYVAAVTPPPDIAQERQQKLSNNDNQITANWKQHKLHEEMLQYTMTLLEELATLEKQAFEVQKEMLKDDKAAVPEIVQTIQAIQAETTKQQQFAHSLRAEIEKLGMARQQLMKDRETIVATAADKLAVSAPPRFQAMLKTSTNSRNSRSNKNSQ